MCMDPVVPACAETGGVCASLGRLVKGVGEGGRKEELRHLGAGKDGESGLGGWIEPGRGEGPTWGTEARS